MVIKKSVVSCIFKNIFELGDPQKVGDLQSPLVAQWITIQHCCKLRHRFQMQLGFSVAVGVA